MFAHLVGKSTLAARNERTSGYRRVMAFIIFFFLLSIFFISLSNNKPFEEIIRNVRLIDTSCRKLMKIIKYIRSSRRNSRDSRDFYSIDRDTKSLDTHSTHLSVFPVFAISSLFLFLIRFYCLVGEIKMQPFLIWIVGDKWKKKILNLFKKKKIQPKLKLSITL